uniref:Uncharacterized protein n=1 Tax=Asparagopsis taxiformis TaxID=260499 RepID=A0A1C9CC37_9FLOR|nr:hypothetical protein Aspa_060 [Asparagopsis taxiformis]AOM65939.1 hypothetical protein Aspa_060 [Asparagopsis taxiformis]
MESLEYLFSSYNLYSEDELLEEASLGWSSVCLDQTINYYIECNSLKSQNKEELQDITE